MKTEKKQIRHGTDDKWAVSMLIDRSLTQAVSTHRDASSVVWVPRHEQSIKFVNLLGDGVHDGLTVGGTIVEEDVQQSLIGKVT